jgi:hypothetical protein
LAAAALAVPAPMTNRFQTPRFSTGPEQPLYFEACPNTDLGDILFLARGLDCNVGIAPGEAVIALARRPQDPTAPAFDRIASIQESPADTRIVRLRLVGAAAQPEARGIDPLTGKANYFVGNDPRQWRTGQPLFRKVQLNQVYPGIDLVYYAGESSLEYDFNVAPGAQPDRITLKVQGADDVRLDKDGNLLLTIGDEEIRQHRPVLYQVSNGVKLPVQGGYQLDGKTTVRFWIGSYDRARPLVIDPSLNFSTYIGGKLNDLGWGIAQDGGGNIYIAGQTLSTDLRTNISSPALQPVYQGGVQQFGDAFVAKYTGGTNLAYLTYLGGKLQDAAFAITADAAGNAFVTGFTDSTNFPIWPADAFQTHLAGRNNNGLHRYPIDAFVTKLDPSGTQVVYSTYFGGDGRDVGLGIAVDSAGSAYITGLTESTNLPTLNTIEGPYVRGKDSALATNYSGAKYHGNGDGFIAKLSPDGRTLQYASYLGGTNQEEGESIAIDAANSAYVAGWTSSSNFPTTSPLTTYLNGQTNRTSPTDAFLAKVDSTGSNLVYSTLWGGNHNDAALHVAVNPATGEAYITGYTFSTNFPITLSNFVSYVSKTNVNSDVFVTKFDTNGSAFSSNGYSVIFGGRRADYGIGLDLDALGDAYVVGSTSSITNFAGVTNASMAGFWATNPPGSFSITNQSIKKYGTNDTFLVVLDPTGSNFLFSAYLGGSGNDQANGIVFDTNANAAYLVGTTTSTNFPGTIPGSSPGKRKYSNAFLSRILFP